MRGKNSPYAISPSGGRVTFDLDVKRHGLEPILGAAYLLTDVAYARLEGDKTRRVRLTLSGKKPLSRAQARGLAEDYLKELHAQKVRWAVARNNLPVREYIAQQAVRVAAGVEAEPPAQPELPEDELTPEQKQEIERLIAEVEAEIRELGAKKDASDPKKVSASWEEKHEAPDPASAANASPDARPGRSGSALDPAPPPEDKPA